jgi:TM2 domain-containing membrane protein YozV
MRGGGYNHEGSWWEVALILLASVLGLVKLYLDSPAKALAAVVFVAGFVWIVKLYMTYMGRLA